MKINQINPPTFQIIYFSDNVSYIRTKEGEWYTYLLWEFRLKSDLEEEELESVYQEFKKNNKL